MLSSGLTLLQKPGDIYTNTPLTARFFVEGTPTARAPVQLHMANLWKPWSTLTEPSKPGPSRSSHRTTRSVKPFIAAMDHNARGRARAVVQAGSQWRQAHARSRRRLGCLLHRLRQAAPGLQAEVVDLADVLPIAQEYIRKAGMADRITTRAGDMLPRLSRPASTIWSCSPPSATCSRPKKTRQLLAARVSGSGPARTPGDLRFHSGPRKTAPRFGSSVRLNMLVNTRAGSSYSEPEYDAWLKEPASPSQTVRLPGPANLMIGTK